MDAREQQEMLWKAERLLGGAEALAMEAADVIDTMDPTDEQLGFAANVLSKASRMVDEAALKRRRAAKKGASA